MMRAIQIRGQPVQQQQQATSGRRGWGSQAAGPAAELIDTSAQQQVAALGALVAALLQLQVGTTRLQHAWEAPMQRCCSAARKLHTAASHSTKHLGLTWNTSSLEQHWMQLLQVLY